LRLWKPFHFLALLRAFPFNQIDMSTQLFQLNNRTAVVIGGTGSLGGAMAEALGAAGARVAVLGRSAERGMHRAEQIRREGGEAIFQSADALDRESLVRAREMVERSLGPVEILINAAGGNQAEATLQPGDDFCQLPLDAWNKVFDLNLIGGTVLPCQVFGETMLLRNSGSIINIASMSGIIPLSRVVAYSAAKAAVINLTQFLAREWAGRGVRVNCISPGFFPAEQNRGLLYNKDGSLSPRGKQIIDHTPSGRFGYSHELAGAIVFLASSAASSFVTGHNLVVDGGFSSTTI
jgi:NAD(P)-dependent dehydrogenase (short-subunit alcohol dehydrogenase family)